MPNYHATSEGNVPFTAEEETAWQAEQAAALAAKPDADRADKWEAIKAKRFERKAAGVNVGGKWFHTDNEESRVQQLGLKDLARDTLAAGGTMQTVLQKLGQNIAWKTMDGTRVPMTAQLAFDVVAAVGDLDALCHYVADQHEAAMRASPDPAAYDFSGGWPATYPG